MTEFNNIKISKIQKGTILLHKGDTSKYGYKIISGCLRSYIVDNSGKEHILQFAIEGWFIGDMDSFFNEKPSAIYIDALENTEYIQLTQSSFDGELEMNNQILEERNFKLIRNIISINRRLISLLSSTAEERYLEFLQTYPTLLQRLPLKLIASYLGMTPEYLSEVRKKITKK
jgi:CRP-like cAMP-binding protein